MNRIVSSTTIRLLPFLLAWFFETMASWLFLQQQTPAVALALLLHLIACVSFSSSFFLQKSNDLGVCRSKSTERPVEYRGLTDRLRAASTIRSLVATGALRERWAETRRSRASALLWSVTSFIICLFGFPLIGLLAASIAYLFSRHTAPVEPLSRLPGVEADDLPTAIKAISTAAGRASTVVEELEIEPLVDLLQEEAPDLKANAIDFLVRNRNKNLAPILLSLLRSPNPDVRFHASVGLSKFENELGKAILAAQRQVGEQASILDLQRLADLYFDYATSGFLDQATSDYYLSQAKEQYLLAIKLEPSNLHLQLRLLRTLVQADELGQAFEVEARITPSTDDELELLLLGMEMRFKSRDFSTLPELARKAMSLVPDDHPDREIVATWAGVD